MCRYIFPIFEGFKSFSKEAIEPQAFLMNHVIAFIPTIGQCVRELNHGPTETVYQK
jgi:hypothetical protein